MGQKTSLEALKSVAMPPVRLTMTEATRQGSPYMSDKAANDKQLDKNTLLRL